MVKPVFEKLGGKRIEYFKRKELHKAERPP
jgi:hypothetical protein